MSLRPLLLALGVAILAQGAPAQQFFLPEALAPEDLDVEPLDPLYDPLLRRVPRNTGRVQSVTETPTETAPAGVLRGLDRISGQVADVTLERGASAELFGRLRVTLQDCRYPEGDPASNAYAYVVVEDGLQDATVFEGWMVATAPALNAMDHARYDVWALRCSNS